MFFDGGKQIAELGSGGDHLDETVELATALLAVHAAVLMGIKDAVNQLLQMVVHSFTRLVTMIWTRRCPSILRSGRESLDRSPLVGIHVQM